MKSTVDCIYCYLRQAVNCMRHAGIKEKEQPGILYELMDLVKGFDMDNTPCYNSTFSILKTYELSGNPDPFKAEKIDSNLKAQKILKSILSDNIDADLHWLLKLSSAGNIIDTGIMFDYNIEKTMEETLLKGFSIDHYDAFVKELENTKTILYLGDNCGEIVFDMPVVKYLKSIGKKVYYAVKTAPILNDALYEDAVFAGIDKYAEIIETGSGFLGVNPEDSSDEFLNILKNADIIISKGQANFESLDDFTGTTSSIYFILKVKCDRIADRIIGSKFGDSVFLKTTFGDRQ